MNYENLYNRFILNRREKEKTFDENKYTEKHHIIPKCMNGSDDKDNLIFLTPEDHFFAHLLLAKAYGGKNWVALHSMLHRGIKTEEISYKDFANKRKTFGFARRLVANSFKGINNSQADKNVYLLKNKDGRSVEGNRTKIIKETELSSRLIGKLVKGKINTAQGWYYPIVNPNGLTTKEKKEIKTKKENSIPLFHFDGREWIGTKKEFFNEFKRPLLFFSENGMCAGWFRTKEQAESYFNRRINNQHINRKSYKFKFIKTKKIYRLSISEMSQKFNIPRHVLYDLVSGQTKVSKKYGIVLV